MSTINYISTPSSSLGGLIKVQWSGLTANDVGQPMAFSNLADKTVQVWGTFGGTVTIQGSNDPLVETDPNSAQWETLTNTLGEAASFTAHGMITLTEAPAYIRPIAGSGVSSVKIVVVANAS